MDPTGSSRAWQPWPDTGRAGGQRATLRGALGIQVAWPKAHSSSKARITETQAHTFMHKCIHYSLPQITTAARNGPKAKPGSKNYILVSCTVAGARALGLSSAFPAALTGSRLELE